MKTMKQVFSMILVLAMMLSLIVLPVHAVELVPEEDCQGQDQGFHVDGPVPLIRQIVFQCMKLPSGHQKCGC